MGHYEIYLDLFADIVLISNSLNINPGFGQIQFFFGGLVSSRLKALASGYCLPVKRFEKESKEANYPHTATKLNL